MKIQIFDRFRLHDKITLLIDANDQHQRRNSCLQQNKFSTDSWIIRWLGPITSWLRFTLFAQYCTIGRFITSTAVRQNKRNMWLCRFSDFLDLCYWFKAGCLLKISGFFSEKYYCHKNGWYGSTVTDGDFKLKPNTTMFGKIFNLNMLSTILEGSHYQKSQKLLTLLYHSR